MIFSVNDVGAVGIIKDKLPHELPPNAWSGGQNIRFVDGYAQKMDGYSAVFGSPSNGAYSLMPVSTSSSYFWLELGLTKAYVWDGAAHTNITRQSAGVDVNYTGGASDVWTGCVLGGIPVMNNGKDLPQMWNPVGTGTKLSALTNWPATATCKTMRNFKQFLVALDVTKSSVRYPQMLKWSHPADPGTVPVSWDETDVTKDAGEYTFSETTDFLIDCASLRDINVVYKEGSVWAQQYIGGVDIFRFYRLFGQFGALNRNCIVEFLTGKHVVLSFGDVVVHDGQTADSILSRKWKKWLNDNVNPDAMYANFVVGYTAREEVWICLCTGSNTLPDTALVWNWRTGAIGIRSLPNVSFIAEGLVNSSTASDAWSADTATWDSDTTSWAQRLYTPSALSLLMSVPGTPQLHKLDAGSDSNGSAMTSSLERTGIGIPFKQNLPPDFTSMKFIRELWPRIEGTPGGVVNVEIGTQMTIGGNVTWKPAQPFTIGTTKKINVTTTGRLLAIRFSSDTAIQWRLHGYEIDVKFGGNF